LGVFHFYEIGHALLAGHVRGSKLSALLVRLMRVVTPKSLSAVAARLG